MNDAEANANRTKLHFLYTDIGRGHPHYLDGIVETLVKRGMAAFIGGCSNVFDCSSGISLLAWRIADYLYRRGPSRPVPKRLYEILRRGNDYNHPTIARRIMSRGIGKRFQSSSDNLVVAHPSLVGMLAGRERLIYQHGEAVAPRESLVQGAELCIVPTVEVAEKFKRAGYHDTQLYVSGLCVEPELVRQADEAYQSRQIRLEQEARLTVAMFSSGAEPDAHVSILVELALNLTMHGQQAFVFARESGNLCRQMRTVFGANGLNLGAFDRVAEGRRPVETTLVRFRNRREQNAMVSRLFGQFNLLVAPSHERTNWALGLGLPMYILGPCFGPYAPLNRELLLNSKVAMEVNSREETARLAETITDTESRRRLMAMSSCGWGKYQVDGFAKIAELLVNRYYKD